MKNKYDFIGVELIVDTIYLLFAKIKKNGTIKIKRVVYLKNVPIHEEDSEDAIQDYLELIKNDMLDFLSRN